MRCTAAFAVRPQFSQAFPPVEMSTGGLENGPVGAQGGGGPSPPLVPPKATSMAGERHFFGGSSTASTLQLRSFPLAAAHHNSELGAPPRLPLNGGPKPLPHSRASPQNSISTTASCTLAGGRIGARDARLWVNGRSVWGQVAALSPASAGTGRHLPPTCTLRFESSNSPSRGLSLFSPSVKKNGGRVGKKKRQEKN